MGDCDVKATQLHGHGIESFDVYVQMPVDAPLRLPGALPPLATTPPESSTRHQRETVPPTTASAENDSASEFSWRALRQMMASDDADEANLVTFTVAHMDDAERCRWSAFFLAVSYVLTFFAWPTPLVGTLGLITAFIGYIGASPTMIHTRRLMWVVAYVWLNCGMMVFNVFVFVRVFACDIAGRNDSQPARIVIGAFVMINLYLHMRAEQITRELVQRIAAAVARHRRAFEAHQQAATEQLQQLQVPADSRPAAIAAVAR